MKTRTLLIGAVVAGGMLAAAMWVARPPAPAKDAALGPLCPTLQQRGNEAARLVIRRGKDELTLEHRDGAWVVAGKGGYPAREEKVVELIRALADARIVAPKTSKPELFSRLNVEDPESETAGSTLVRVEDSGGGLITAVILGKREETAGAAFDTPRFYARRPGENQSYLASGDVRADPAFVEWVNRTIIELRNERVRSATVLHADGAVRMTRDKPETQSFTLEGVPEGRVPREDYELTRLAWALSYLTFDDVMLSSALPEEGEQPLPVEFRCFDGLLVRLVMHRHEGGDWVTLNSFFEAPDQSGDQPPAPTEALAKEIESLNKAWAGRAFKIQPYKAAALRSTMDDLTTTPEQPKDTPAEPTPAGSNGGG